MAGFVLDYSRYCVPTEGHFALTDIDPGDSQGLVRERDGAQVKARLAEVQVRLDELQHRLFAESKQALLLVLQAMDTAGKDNTIRRVMAPLNPMACRVTNFKSPSGAERARDFLWRVHSHVPRKGSIGVFNRSHYEDVLIARVHGLAPLELVEKRYDHINDFERMLTDHSTRIVKVMLHISKEYQLKRLQRRLQRADKHWKFLPDDLRDRERWDDYMAAYDIMLQRCSTPYAPWYVIPAENRWLRNLIISQLLLDNLEDMNPQFPAPQFDPADYPPETIT